MTDWFLKLLGVPTGNALEVAGFSLALRGGVGTGWVLVLLVLVGGLVYVLYLQSPGELPPWRRRILTTLRILVFALILMLFLRPVLALTVEGSVRRVLVMLMDGSASMQIKDPRLEPADQKRAALARGVLDASKGLNQSLEPSAMRGSNQPTRLETVKQALGNKQLDLLPRLDRHFDVAAFSFGQGLLELSARKNLATNNAAGDDNAFGWVQRLAATNTMTALGDGLREVITRKRGQPLAGIVLITDGANNSGSQPREIASLLRQERIPIYAYGVGITRPRDVIVGNLFAPDVTFAQDEVAVTVRVRSQGLKDQTGELVLKLGNDTVARKPLTFAEDGEQVVPLRFIPPAPGDFDLEASVVARPDETVQDNNARRHRLRVVDSRIKVLLVEQTPRWEFRYLQAMLMRDRRVELRCFLVEGDPGISRAENSPYLPAFPSRKEELFAFDLVILGDVDPKALSAAQQENLGELVSRFGSALVMVAGKRFSPVAYKQTVFERMLPVEFDVPTLESTKDPAADKPIRLELTSAGRSNPILRLADREEDNVTLWKGLPPVYWVARVARPKPAAEVLLVDPDPAKESRFGKMPVVALQQYGLGRVVYVGTDNTWRWRKNVGDAYYTALWGQITEHVTLQRLLGGSKRTQLHTDRQNFHTGDRVSIFARLYGVGFEPVQEPQVKGVYGLKNGQGPRAGLTMRPIPEQPGLYRAEFVAGAPGHYQFFVEQDLETPLDFTVAEPKFELGETAMNEPLLRDLATATGGAFFREEDLLRLPDTIRQRSERVQSPLEVELWASPLYFLLLLGVLTGEWVLRKMSYLK